MTIGKQIIHYSMELFAILPLFYPAIWEVRNDRHGDFDKALDVVKRVALFIAAALLNYLLREFHFMHIDRVGPILLGMIQPAILSFGLFFFIFDYWIAFRLGHYKDFFSYLGKKGTIDNIAWWRGMKPGWRFVVRLIVLHFTILIYLIDVR